MRNLAARLSHWMRPFLRWWIRALADALDELVARVGPRSFRPLTVYATATEVVIWGGIAAPGLPYHLDRSSIAENSATTPLGHRGVDISPYRRARVLLSTDYAFIRRVTYPAAALPHLASAIRLQLEQLVPLALSLLSVDHEVVASNETDSLVHVDLASVRKVDVERIRQIVNSRGLRVVSIHLGDSPQGPPRFRFAGSEGGRLAGFGLRRVDRILLAAAVTLSCCCLGIATAETIRARHALNLALSVAEPKARELIRQRDQIDTASTPLRELARVQRAPSPGEVLSEVTKRLPHDAWLTAFDVKDGALRLVGLATDSASVTRSIAVTPLLTDVQLRSSVWAGVGVGKDHFEITARVRESTP